MNSKSKSLKFIALVLSIMVLLQGCISVFKPSTIQEAIHQSNKVVVKSTTNQRYEFISLFTYEDKLYGITESNSKTALELERYAVSSGNSPINVQIDLSKLSIERVSVMNNDLSFMLNILFIPIAAALGYYVLTNSISVY